MKTLALIAFLASSASAFAALPPYWDSVKRIEAVINSPVVAARLVGPIVSIRVAQGLTYDIASVNCTARVTLKAHPPGRPGPTTYTVQSVSRVVCR